MKKKLPTLLLLAILLTAMLQAKAQSSTVFQRLYQDIETQRVEKTKLPNNRTAFIFDTKSSAPEYSNPALALVSTPNKKHIDNIKTEQASVSSFMENYSNEIKLENICMFSNNTDDELWIQLNNESRLHNMNVEIYNQEGERIYNSMLADNLHKINVCNFTAGTFLVKLGDNVQKLIIE